MVDPARRKPAGELLPARKFLQLIRIDRPDLSAVSPMLATYARPVGGVLLLELFRAPATLSPRRRLPWIGRFRDEPATYLNAMHKWLKHPIASLRLEGAQIVDNDMVDIFVTPGSVRAGEYVILQISASGVSAENAPTVWTSSGADRIPGHISCAFDGTDFGAYGLSGALAYSPAEPAKSLPHMILYSPITQCNLNCIHCISRDTRKSFNRLTPAIKDHIQGWADDGRLISMNTDYSGDLLWADHRFGGELDFVIGLNIPFQIDTNGVFLTHDVAERLCRSRITHLNISLDAARDETYRRVRVGAPSLQEVLDNVRELVRIRARAGARFRVMLGITLMTSTLDEWVEFVRLAADVGADGINAAHLHAYTADMEAESLWHAPETFNRVRAEALDLAHRLGLLMGAPPPFHGVQENGHRHCPAPWESAVILGNGDVAACCVPGTVMGNLHEQSMEEIWTGARYRTLRATINSDSPPKPCSICPMFRRVGNGGSYLQYSARDIDRSDAPFIARV